MNMSRAVKPRILIVEDDSDIQMMLYTYLEDDYIVEQAFNGEEGLAHLQAQTPDVILLDIKMSPIDGYQFIEQIEQRGLPHVPILILTAFGDVQIAAVELLRKNQDVKNILMKPMRYLSYLNDSIEEAIHENTY